MRMPTLLARAFIALAAVPAHAQVDADRAAAYFAEADVLCQRDAGRLWGVSLCGPMVFADASTQTIATNQPAPDAPRPRALGFANTAIDWGGERWSTYVWSFLPPDDAAGRARLLMHEHFHRVQPGLGLMVIGGSVDHLDTLDGRYWLQLEWRALAAALAANADERKSAIADVLAFRAARRALFADSARNENADEIREGLAQYTGIVLAAAHRADAVRAAVEQLEAAPEQPTFVRSFAYASGPAYGLLLDDYAPSWRSSLTSTSDLGALAAAAANVAASTDSAAAALRYDATALRASEERRELERQARVAELTARFVEGPIVTFPRPRSASLITTGSTPIPGIGTVFVEYHASDAWGSIDVERGGVLLRDESLVVPAPATIAVAARAFSGDGWRVTLAEGWLVRPGPRTGDYVVTRSE